MLNRPGRWLDPAVAGRVAGEAPEAWGRRCKGSVVAGGPIGEEVDWGEIPKVFLGAVGVPAGVDTPDPYPDKDAWGLAVVDVWRIK